MELPELRGAKAKTIERAWLQILDDNVCACDELGELCPALGGRKVNDERLLASVQPDEIARLPVGNIVIASGEITLGDVQS